MTGLADKAVRAPFSKKLQCECALPVPQRPHDFGVPVQVGAGSALPEPDAKTESFFFSFLEPQSGQGVPFQFDERTRISLSLSQCSQ